MSVESALSLLERLAEVPDLQNQIADVDPHSPGRDFIRAAERHGFFFDGQDFEEALLTLERRHRGMPQNLHPRPDSR